MITLEEKREMRDLTQKMLDQDMSWGTIMESLATKEKTSQALKVMKITPKITEQEFKKQMGMK